MLPRSSASSIDSRRPARTARSSVSCPTRRRGQLRVDGEHELLARRVELARRPVQAVEDDPLERGWNPLAREGLPLLARVGDLRLAIGQRALGELDADQHGRGQTERAEREQALRDGSRRSPPAKRSPATPARTAKSAERRNEDRNARVNTACTDSSSESRAAATSGLSSAPCSSNGRDRSGISPSGTAGTPGRGRE